jgi:tripartite-type tricarboxylate transporter receptor subunit TctC
MILRIALSLCWLWLVSVPAGAQSPAPGGPYPFKPLRFIVPFAPGGMPDSVSRTLAQHLSEKFGQAVVVDNRPGASQAIALDAAAKAPPDGYTMVLGTMSGLIFLTASRKSLPYDPFKDLTSVTLMMATPFFIGVHPSIPASNVGELIAVLKARPGKLFYGTLGIASGQHLVTELFKSRTGTDIVHVPFKAGYQAQNDLLAGQVHLMFDGPGILTQIRTGKLRGIAATSLKRANAAPEMPTLSETVLPGFDVVTWFGLSVPTGVPRPIIDRLNRETVALLRSPALRDKFASTGLEWLPSTPEEMTERIRSEYPVWVKVMRSAGIDPE